MIKKEVIDDISEHLGVDIDIDNLTSNIQEEIKELDKIYKNILRIRNIVSVESKSLFISKKKKLEISENKRKLEELKKSYSEKLEQCCLNIKNYLDSQKIKSKESTYKVVNINGNNLMNILSKPQLNDLKCPNCGAPLKIGESDQQIKCEYCGSVLSLNDIQNLLTDII